MFDKYLSDINRLYRSGNATEHSYRPALQNCLTLLLKDVQATNEPKRQKCGAPDFILTRRKIDIGYIEAKDIGIDLNTVENDEQLTRYRESLDNLILTDYVDFRFFLNGEKVEQIRIAEPTKKGGLTPIPENFARLQSLLVDFAAFQGQPIKSAKKLAEMMAHKAALMRDVFFMAVKDESGSETSLKDQLEAFKTVLVHDMDEAQFADVYAQTIAYGLFTARLHDETPKEFSRTEALNLIPKSNPFLRQLFHYVAGPDLDSRVIWIVDALSEVFRYADLAAILKDFGTATGKNDPILHFYETFLAEYDPKLRKSRGVWYTPEPVVRYIVRAIDDVLKADFGLKEGLAHTGMVEIEVDGHAKGKTVKIKRQVHKVQLLDVATGTGTFLAEVVKQIYARFKGQKGAWSSYVDEHLLPRMHGFELLMASYAMCHMKLELLLKETGYVPSNPANPPRLSVYLTNSLEEYHPDSDTLFAQWLSKEANEASRIKKDMPIMVAFGNPPYSGHSSNMGSWATGLVDAYKFEADGSPLKERMYKWLQDDYVKFIRLGEHYIERNGEGILAYITNHSYLDNPTFRGMRWHLLNTFDDIHILDLHGSAKKTGISPDGLMDKNVFDIQQGVAVIVAIKRKQDNKKQKSPARVHHADVWGDRQDKYDFLEKNNLETTAFQKVECKTPFFFFVPRSYKDEETYYNRCFGIPELFSLYGDPAPGLVSTHDEFAISYSSKEAIEKVEKFLATKSEQEARQLFKLCSQDQWLYERAKHELPKQEWRDQIVPISYRPFDDRVTVYNKNVAVHRRERASKHFLSGKNIGLVTCRQIATNEWTHSYIARFLTDDSYISNRSKERGYVFPLFIFENDLASDGTPRPNLEPKIYKAIQKIVPDVQPQSLFDYIYAVLHSRAYRQRYAEFLKSDFPRIPYPKDPKTFHALAARGAELRGLHLMESPVLDKLITDYLVNGNHEVVALRWEDTKGKPGIGRVWINPTQYFDKVPLTAWEFYIGGYQPAQKWLKDRKSRKLTSDDLLHWQRIIVALTDTDRIMHDIDQIDFLPET